MRVSNMDKHTGEGEISARLRNYKDVYKHDHITRGIPFVRAIASSVVADDTIVRRPKLTAKRKTLLKTILAYRKVVQRKGTAEPDELHGLCPASISGRPSVVEYEPEQELHDTEQVPLLHKGGVKAYLHEEVLPYAQDASYVPGSVKVGYEISFNRHFYKAQPLRHLQEIRADILALERETEGLLSEIIA